MGLLHSALAYTGDMISSHACHWSMAVALQPLIGRARSCSTIDWLRTKSVGSPKSQRT